MPDMADAQARRNGHGGQRGGRGQDDAPATAPAAVPNPRIIKLIEGYGWQKELDKIGTPANACEPAREAQ